MEIDINSEIKLYKTMEKQKELKIGTKVLLTGWSESNRADTLNHKIFKNEGHRFPLECQINDYLYGIFKVLDNWEVDCFTYKIIPDETPVP